MVKPISPYLLRPLRSLDDALREMEQRQGEAETGPTPDAPAPPPEAAGKGATPTDRVTIAGKDVAIEPTAPAADTPGRQVDLKA